MRHFNPAPFIAVAAVVAFAAGPAAAHSRLVGATPAPNATVAATRTLSQTVRARTVPALSGFDVVKAAGEKVAIETSVSEDGTT
ncbi:MAG: copper resistance protein CopC, partial [bacterium]